jgi:soluble lytic murein transglycosylase-like protein
MIKVTSVFTSVLMLTSAAWLMAPVIDRVERWNPNALNVSIAKWALYYGVRADVLDAMARVESERDHRAVEKIDGAEISFGVCQVGEKSVRTFEECERVVLHGATAKEKLFDQDQCVRVAAWQLALHLRVFGDYPSAVSAHNIGARGLVLYRERTGNRTYLPYMRRYAKTGVVL